MIMFFQVPLEAAINDCERDYEWHDVRFLKTLIKLDFLVRMICKESAMFFTNLAYTYAPFLTRTNLKKFISTEVLGIKQSFKIFTTFAQLKMKNNFLMANGSKLRNSDFFLK